MCIKHLKINKSVYHIILELNDRIADLAAGVGLI